MEGDYHNMTPKEKVITGTGEINGVMAGKKTPKITATGQFVAERRTMAAMAEDIALGLARRSLLDSSKTFCPYN